MFPEDLKRSQESVDEEKWSCGHENQHRNLNEMKCMKWIKMVYPNQLGKGFVDENEGDEDGEDFLGKAWDITYQEAALTGDSDHHNDDKPHPNPHSRNYILNVLGLAKLNKGNWGWVDCNCNEISCIIVSKWIWKIVDFAIQNFKWQKFISARWYESAETIKTHRGDLV